MTICEIFCGMWDFLWKNLLVVVIEPTYIFVVPQKWVKICCDWKINQIERMMNSETWRYTIIADATNRLATEIIMESICLNKKSKYRLKNYSSENIEAFVCFFLYTKIEHVPENVE